MIDPTQEELDRFVEQILKHKPDKEIKKTKKKQRETNHIPKQKEIE